MNDLEYRQMLEREQEVVDRLNKKLFSGTTEEKLKPCPFCGEIDHVSSHHNGLDLWSVSCFKCGVLLEIAGGGFFTEGEAIISWNQRPNVNKP